VYVTGVGGAEYMLRGKYPIGWDARFVNSSRFPDCSIVELLSKGYYRGGWDENSF